MVTRELITFNIVNYVLSIGISLNKVKKNNNTKTVLQLLIVKAATCLQKMKQYLKNENAEIKIKCRLKKHNIALMESL